MGFSELGEEEEKARGFEVSAEGQRAVSKEYFCQTITAFKLAT